MQHSGHSPAGGLQHDSPTDHSSVANSCAVPATSERYWHSVATDQHDDNLITNEALRDLLCAAESIPPDQADQTLEAHALSTGLIRIGEIWFATMPTFVLPSMPRAIYDRILRALRGHFRDCDGDRVRHGGLGNHGAARALASEMAATTRTLEFIETHTRTQS